MDGLLLLSKTARHKENSKLNILQHPARNALTIRPILQQKPSRAQFEAEEEKSGLLTHQNKSFACCQYLSLPHDTGESSPCMVNKEKSAFVLFDFKVMYFRQALPIGWTDGPCP